MKRLFRHVGNKVAIDITLCNKKTCWYLQTRETVDNDKLTVRNDILFGITRQYHREHNKYIYNLFAGRLNITLIFE
jgi:hypothetical protein